MFGNPISLLGLLGLLVSAAGVLLVLRGRRALTIGPPLEPTAGVSDHDLGDDAGARGTRARKQSHRTEIARSVARTAPQPVPVDGEPAEVMRRLGAVPSMEESLAELAVRTGNALPAHQGLLRVGTDRSCPTLEPSH